MSSAGNLVSFHPVTVSIVALNEVGSGRRVHSLDYSFLPYIAFQNFFFSFHLSVATVNSPRPPNLANTFFTSRKNRWRYRTDVTCVNPTRDSIASPIVTGVACVVARD